MHHHPQNQERAFDLPVVKPVADSHTEARNCLDVKTSLSASSVQKFIEVVAQKRKNVNRSAQFTVQVPPESTRDIFLRMIPSG